MNFDYLTIEHFNDKIAILSLNRPNKLNAMTQKFFSELKDAVSALDKDKNIVTVIVKGNGRGFCAGMDFYDFFEQAEKKNAFSNPERFLNENVKFMQDSISSIAKSNKVYIAVIHGVCLGSGLDLVSACDIRLSTKDASFSILETKLGIVDDLGAIQRLPRIIGEGYTKLLAYTSMKIDAEMAFKIGLVEQLFDNYELLMDGAIKLAEQISSNPAKAIFGTKEAFRFALNHNVDECLKFAANYNIENLDFQNVKETFIKNLGG